MKKNKNEKKYMALTVTLYIIGAVFIIAAIYEVVDLIKKL